MRCAPSPSSSICSTCSGSDCAPTPTSAACVCSATCRSTSISTASTCGGIGVCSASTRTAGRRRSPACRPTTSMPTASSGAIRCTTGTRCRRDGFRWWLERIAQPAAALRSGAHRSLPRARIVLGGSGRRADRARRPLARAPRRRAARRACEQQLGAMPLVAEDLGIITPEVRALRDRFELPGMVVLQFAFDGSTRQPVSAGKPCRTCRRLHRHARQRHDGRLVALARATRARGWSRGSRCGQQHAVSNPMPGR